MEVVSVQSVMARKAVSPTFAVLAKVAVTVHAVTAKALFIAEPLGNGI